jgi:hypothetical protein
MLQKIHFHNRSFCSCNCDSAPHFPTERDDLSCYAAEIQSSPQEADCSNYIDPQLGEAEIAQEIAQQVAEEASQISPMF